MPNWCYNQVRFLPEDISKVKAAVTSDENAFDFDKVVPMPESLWIASGAVTFDVLSFLSGTMTGSDSAARYPDEGDEPDPAIFHGGERLPKTLPELRAFARLSEENRAKYGASDWHEWRCKNWGVKWNASDAVWDGNTVAFYTAWSPPIPFFEALSERIGVGFEVHSWVENGCPSINMRFAEGEMVECVTEDISYDEDFDNDDDDASYEDDTEEIAEDGVSDPGSAHIPF